MYNDNDIMFWIEEESESGRDIKIDQVLILDFLQQKGFHKTYLDNNSIFVHVENNIISEVSIEQIKDFVQHYITNAPKNLTKKSSNEQIRKAVIKYNNLCFSKNNLQFLKEIKLNLNSDTVDTAYFYFRKGYIKVSKEKIDFITYEELDHFIWKNQIIDKFFFVNDNVSDFEQFIRNICKNDEDRIKSLSSAIGYLLHSYKDPTNAKAIIFCDEELSSEPNGRTGKSLVGKAIGKIKKIEDIDGKRFNINERFAFQKVELDTQVINFNDVKANFNFEYLFSILTDSLIVEKKGQKSFTIPFKDSPKILISTNYAINGSGESFKGRMFEVEFSNHYDSEHLPINDFGKRFFDDWNDNEWSSFFTFMIKCTQFYLQNGLVKYNHINLDRKKLEQITSPEFCAFADKIERNTEFDKAELFEKFINENPQFPNMQRTFHAYLKTYCKHYNIHLKERKSAGQILIILVCNDLKSISLLQ